MPLNVASVILVKTLLTNVSGMVGVFQIFSPDFHEKTGPHFTTEICMNSLLHIIEVLLNNKDLNNSFLSLT